MKRTTSEARLHVSLVGDFFRALEARQIISIGVGVVLVGSLWGVQREERAIRREHTRCTERMHSREATRVVAKATVLEQKATIEASENGKVVKGYVVPQSIHELKAVAIKVLPPGQMLNKLHVNKTVIGFLILLFGNAYTRSTKSKPTRLSRPRAA